MYLRMIVIDSIEGLREYSAAKAPRVLVDTNILNYGTEGSAEKRTFIQQLCTKLDMYICDTVYWEFLRNVNVETFRKRRIEIASWKEGDLLKEQGIVREDENVRTMHCQIFLLLLMLNERDPKHVLHLLSPDLWIAAVAITHRHDYVLTTNKKDFPSELFEEIADVSTGDFHVHLLLFRREHVRELWKKLDRERTIVLRCDGFFQKK